MKLQSEMIILSNNFGVLYPDDKSDDLIKEYNVSICKAEFIISSNELEKIAKKYKIEYEGTPTEKSKEQEPPPRQTPQPVPKPVPKVY